MITRLDDEESVERGLKGVEQWDKNKLLVARSEDPILKYFRYLKGQPTGLGRNLFTEYSRSITKYTYCTVTLEIGGVFDTADRLRLIHVDKVGRDNRLFTKYLT